MTGSAVRTWRSRKSAWLSRKTAWIGVWALVAGISVYRIATFIPQPLDGPHTLRPVLNGWLDAFLRHYEHPETAYEDWRTLCLFALMVAPALAVVNFVREEGAPGRVARILCSRGVFFVSIAATLLLCRFPTLVDYQLNPDEGQVLAAAHKLFYEGNYFDSVDCGTSGPLNIYPLMLPAIFGVSPDYASSRIQALMLAFVTIYLFYRTVRLLAPDSIARIAILPLAGIYAVFEHPNLVFYSSEQISVVLIALALFLAVRVLLDPAVYRVRLFLLGFLVSAAFFSKMQSVPIVGAICGVAIARVWASLNGRRFQPVLLFVAGMLPLQVLNAAMCLAAGVWRDFRMSYLVTNQSYAGTGSNFVTEMPGLVTYFVSTPEVGYFLFMLLALGACYAVQHLRGSSVLRMAVASGFVIGALMAVLLHTDASAISAYLVMMVIFVTLMSALLLYQKESFGIDPVRWFGLLAIAATASAVFSVYRPHRPFPHYLFFLFVPTSAVMAWMLVRNARQRRRFPLMFAALALTNATFLWGTRDPHVFRTTVATIRQSEGDFIRSLTSPKGQILVWGWTADPYLGSGRVSATRDLNLSYEFLAPANITAYYRERLLNDLIQNPPELIVDAISSNSWALDEPRAYGFAQVPEIARWINDFYRHIADGYGERFFLRADLMTRVAAVKMPEACAPAAVRCIASPRRFYPDGVTTPLMDDLPAVKLPEHALIEIQFTPFGRQTANATVLNTEAAPGSFRGLRFENAGGDLYRLLLGLGDRWVESKTIPLPESTPVRLSIEFSGLDVRIQANGLLMDTVRLPASVSDSPGPIKIGSWINGECRFSGAIQFFQIVDLGAVTRR